MSWLVEMALRMRVAVLALAVLLIIVGIRLIPALPLDVFPEFAPPYIEIQTEAPGLSAEEVENLVSFPLENALIGTPGLETLRSKSVLGLSSIRLLLHQCTGRALFYHNTTGTTGQNLGRALGNPFPRLGLSCANS